MPLSTNRRNVIKQTLSTPLLSWDTIDNNKNESRAKDNKWRWSESPDVDIEEDKQSTIIKSRSTKKHQKRKSATDMKKKLDKYKSSNTKRSKRKHKKKSANPKRHK